MRTVIGAFVLASTVWAQAPQTPTKTAPQQGPPPKNLTVRPDGHVSANQDPANPEKFETYVVKQGDTLSQISGQVLNNLRFWPQLWEQNEHIVNPHWIYPNDVILIKPVTAITEAKPPEPEPAPPAAPEPAPEPPAPPRRVVMPPPAPPQQPSQPLLIVDEQKPVSQIKFDDLYCSGFVRTSPIANELKVISKFDPTASVLAVEAEYVYLSQGSEGGVETGKMYQVVRPTKMITNPNGRTKRERDLGMHYLDVAQLRVVLSQPDFSVARVTYNCADAVDVGDLVMPFNAISLPALSRQRPFSPLMTTTSGVAGAIVSTKDVLLNFGSSFHASREIAGVHGDILGPVERGIAGTGQIVYIDIGQDKGVKAGDAFIVYRYLERDDRLYDYPKEAKKLGAARRAIGELVVLKVGERAASAVVTYASDAMVLGDGVERR